MADLNLALSVHAPWAWSLIYGGKDVENRSSNFARRHGRQEMTGKRFWVHASKFPHNPSQRSWDDFGDCCEAATDKIHETRGEFPPFSGEQFDQDFKLWGYMKASRGHILGSVEIVEFRPHTDPPDSVWYIPGSLAIVVRDPRPLLVPVAAKGRQGWWRPDEETRARLEEAARG